MSASRPSLDGRPCQDGGMRCWTCGQYDCDHDRDSGPFWHVMHRCATGPASTTITVTARQATGIIRTRFA